jgi:hypothetical protein
MSPPVQDGVSVDAGLGTQRRGVEEYDEVALMKRDVTSSVRMLPVEEGVQIALLARVDASAGTLTGWASPQLE